MWHVLTNLWRGTLDYLAPPQCWFCLTPVDDAKPLCQHCDAAFTYDPEPVCPGCASSLADATARANVCPRCMKESFAFDAAVRLGPYDEPRKSAVIRCKSPHGEVFAEAIAPSAARALAAKVRPLAPDGTIPIPLHWKRRLWRGYNSSETFARALAAALGVPLWVDGLKRIRNTGRQVGRSAAERKVNVRGAFSANGRLDLTDKVIVLVDDVMTTGATAHEAARILKKGGAKSVVVAVVAHERRNET